MINQYLLTSLSKTNHGLSNLVVQLALEFVNSIGLLLKSYGKTQNASCELGVTSYELKA